MVCKDILCRTVLWYSVFFGCGVNYMIRSNINIAIVAMVRERDDSENGVTASECYVSQDSQPNITETTMSLTRHTNEVKFDWDEKQQNYILGAFYWSYWASQISGGTMAKKYGPKAVFGLSNLYLCLATYFAPVLSKFGGVWALVSLRISQGLVGGLCWPALHDIVAMWVPPNERSKFMSAYMGSSIGAALTYPLCGLLIHYLGWESVFYMTASVGVVWFISWWVLIFDTPAQHPRITEEEKLYIEESLGKTVSANKLPVPWWKMIKSGPFWLTAAVSWGCLWGMFTLLTQAPTYFKFVHGWGMRMNGFLSGIPHLCRTTLAIVLAHICDTLLIRGICSVTTIRKIAASVCCLIQGVFLLGLSFSGCNAIVAIVCLTIALSTTGAESAGPLATYVDLAPNHASVLFGISNMVTVIPGFVSPVVVAALTFQNQTATQWQYVHLIAAAMTFIPGILFLIFGTSEVQPWNSEQESSSEEMEKLNTNEYAEKKVQVA